MSYNVNCHILLPLCNTELDEAQAGIKTAGRNIKNLRYAEDTTLMGENEQELKGLFDECERGE